MNILKKMKNKISKGFTLLELLVVIGIIGVIMALATVAYSTTQKSGRNSRRKQDLVAIQGALEQYYSTNGFAYPNTDCTLAASNLKSSWPVDPGDSEPYSGVTNCSSTFYCICDAMEGTAQSGNSGPDCTFAAAKTHYCVSNLQ